MPLASQISDEGSLVNINSSSGVLSIVSHHINQFNGHKHMGSEDQTEVEDIRH